MTPNEKRRLAAIRKRERKASPGPWAPDPAAGDDIVDDKGNDVVVTDSHVYPPEPDDFAFIMHSRTDIPFLLDLVSKLEAQRNEARKHLEGCAKARAADVESALALRHSIREILATHALSTDPGTRLLCRQIEAALSPKP